MLSKICLAVAGVIIITFFAVQSCIVFGICPPSYFLSKFGFGCVVAFLPPFLYVVIDFVKQTKVKEANIDLQLNAIDKANIVMKLNMLGHIKKVNNNFTKALGYTAKEVTGKEHKTILSREFINSTNYLQFWKTLKKGDPVSGEFECIAKDGNSKWLFGNYTPIKDSKGAFSNILFIASDLTIQHEAENALNQKNTYLEHAAKILRHDMHSGINTYMPRGLKSLKRRLTKQQQKDLKIESPLKMLEEGLKHTQRVYSGVKEFTNLVKQDTQLEKTMCNLQEILVDYLSATSYSKQVAIDVLPSVEVNEPLFCTAIDNLIRNGLKYNDSESKMVVIYMEDDSHMCIQDNGRGMDQFDFEELSKPYTRKEDQAEAGSGLGLNICLAILKEHGFSITAEKLELGTKLKVKIKIK